MESSPRPRRALRDAWSLDGIAGVRGADLHDTGVYGPAPLGGDEHDGWRLRIVRGPVRSESLACGGDGSVTLIRLCWVGEWGMARVSQPRE